MAQAEMTTLKARLSAPYNRNVAACLDSLRVALAPFEADTEAPQMYERRLTYSRLVGPYELLRDATPGERTVAVARMTAAQNVNRDLVADDTRGMTVISLMFLRDGAYRETFVRFAARHGVTVEQLHRAPSEDAAPIPLGAARPEVLEPVRRTTV